MRKQNSPHLDLLDDTAAAWWVKKTIYCGFFYYIEWESGTIWNWTITQRFGHLHNIRELGCFSFLFFFSFFLSFLRKLLKKSGTKVLWVQIYSESNLEYLHWFTLLCAKQKCPLNIVCKKAKMHQGWNQPTVSLQSEKQFSKVWLSSHISFTKEHFQPSDSGKLYTSWPLFFSSTSFSFSFLNLWLTSWKKKPNTVKIYNPPSYRTTWLLPLRKK